MRKIYFSLLLIASYGLSFGQTIEKDQAESVNCAYKPAKNANTGPSNRVVVWSEDFAGGFPATWTKQNTSGICPWVYSTDGSWGNFNGNGATAGGTAIASTTAANGFLICDPDSANHFTYGQPSGTTYQYLESYFTTSAIDCSSFPNVLLEFQQFFRFNNSVNLNVMVSNDSTNWTTWTVQGAATNNTASPNADLVSINISSVAGSQSTVYVKIGWNARVYYWMIDDMQIVEAQPNDLKIVNTSYSNVTPLSTGNNIKYTHVPTGQVAPVQFKADVVNNGALQQANCNASINVVDAGMVNYYTGNATATTLNPGDTLHATITSFTPATTARDYKIIYNATYPNSGSDATINNNSDTGWVKVTNEVYGRDNNTYTGAGLWNGAGNPYVMGNSYQTTNAWSVNTIQAAFTGSTNAGVVAYAEIYEIDAGGNFNLIVTSGGGAMEKTITTADISVSPTITWVNFQIPQTMLSASSEYIACIGHYGGSDELVIMNGGVSPAQTTFLLDGTDNTWYYTTSTPMIRLSNTNVGVDELSNAVATLSQSYPNPTSGITNINFNLVKSANVTFELVDVTGKLVYSSVLGHRSAGEGKITLDATRYDSGVYFYSLIVDGQKLTKKLIIE